MTRIICKTYEEFFMSLSDVSATEVCQGFRQAVLTLNLEQLQLKTESK